MTIRPQKLGPYWLIGATTFSRIGTLAYTVVMTWAVSKAGGNNSVGWVNAAAGFTIVLVGTSAAFWLDKFDKRTLLLLLDASAAVVCLAAAAVLLLVPMSSVVFTGMVVAVVTSAAPVCIRRPVEHSSHQWSPQKDWSDTTAFTRVLAKPLAPPGQDWAHYYSRLGDRKPFR